MVSMTSVLNMANRMEEGQTGNVYSRLIVLDSFSFRVWALGEPLPLGGRLTTGHTLTQTITLSIGKEEQDDG